MPSFTTMAFGSAWGTKDWDASTIHPIISREVERSWRVRGMGDFGIGLLPTFIPENGNSGQGWEVSEIYGLNLQEVQWIGYAGIRDATTTSMPAEASSQPTTHPWTQMIELRYGFHPSYWSKGYGTEAARAIMGWCEQSFGVQRFIAETEAENKGSARILGKLGFVGMQGTKEWERRVG
jgi:RimJ/RimL family protein N-acetyltransferase